MSVQTDPPQPDVKYVTETGELTTDGLLLLQKMKRALDDAQKRLDAAGL